MPMLGRSTMALWCWDWCGTSRAGRLGRLGVVGGGEEEIVMISLWLLALVVIWVVLCQCLDRNGEVVVCSP
jgi:hypothetical protein